MEVEPLLTAQQTILNLLKMPLLGIAQITNTTTLARRWVTWSFSWDVKNNVLLIWQNEEALMIEMVIVMMIIMMKNDPQTNINEIGENLPILGTIIL